MINLKLAPRPSSRVAAKRRRSHTRPAGLIGTDSSRTFLTPGGGDLLLGLRHHA